jgi:hypothetical protein
MIDLKPVVFQDYWPDPVKRVILKLEKLRLKKVSLIGFGKNMFLYTSILRQKKINFQLYDINKKYFNFKCSNKKVENLSKMNNNKNEFAIVCIHDPKECEEIIWELYNKKPKVRILYDSQTAFDPTYENSDFYEILKKADKVSRSMISRHQLFDLAQLVKFTADIPGEILEFGCHTGGSSAVIIESVKKYCPEKKIRIFDSFDGIPRSKYGLDNHWELSFSDNSYDYVKNLFSGEKNVQVIEGNIIENTKNIKNKISLVYLASDTLESGENIIKNTWSRLSKGGVILVCDVGSYPNAIPLTVYVKKFFNKIRNVNTFYTGGGSNSSYVGFFAVKK